MADTDGRTVDADRRSALRVAAGLWATALAGCLGGDDDAFRARPEKTPTPASTLDQPPSIGSPAFAGGEAIPTRFTCDGANVSPELSIDDVPEEAVSLALLLDDPDVPGGTFTHWLLWGLSPSTTSIPEGVPRGPTVEALGGAKQGTNDAGGVGYTGPCPPPDDGAHTYRFRLFALAEPLGVEVGAGRAAFDGALARVTHSRATLRGTYDRQRAVSTRPVRA